MLLVLTCLCHPVSGDKSTTLHEKKGVKIILNKYDMPYVNNEPAEIGICATSILAIGTTSQLLEATYNEYAINSTSLPKYTIYIDAYLRHI